VVVNGKAVIGRKTRWGAVVVEDENHCEFTHLRNFLTRTHLQDLVETTAMVHYETFRSNQLMALKGAVSPNNMSSPTTEANTPGAMSSTVSEDDNNSSIPVKAFPPFA
jgi:septin 3/9/12